MKRQYIAFAILIFLTSCNDTIEKNNHGKVAGVTACSKSKTSDGMTENGAKNYCIHKHQKIWNMSKSPLHGTGSLSGGFIGNYFTAKLENENSNIIITQFSISLNLDNTDKVLTSKAFANQWLEYGENSTATIELKELEYKKLKSSGIDWYIDGIYFIKVE